MSKAPLNSIALLACATLAQTPSTPFQTSSIPFVLNNAATPEKHQPETMPGGVTLLDYDNDGRLDIFFANGAPQPTLVKSSPAFHNRLFRNLGNLKFEDVTAKAGLAGEGFSFGAAAADFDNDGYTDLLVTSLAFSRLYRNRGDGTFLDVTAQARIPPTPWPLSAGWFDLDNDGFLDLFLINYCRWDPATEPFCGDRRANYRTYCHPKFYEGLPNTLLRNNRDGTFSDISLTSGISSKIGKGMAVAFADYNNDGLTDILATNDTTPNFLFRNDGGGRFTETAFSAGVAIPDDGRTLSTMGGAFTDIDDDGRPDIFATALANETFPLFRNLGNGAFQDLTYRSKIGAASMPHSGWSLGVFDFDNDGRKDIFSANGDVQDNTELFSSRASKQQNQLFLNKTGLVFESILFGEKSQHRGAAFGDLDNDGRIDAVLTRLNQPALLLRNTLNPANHYLALELRGTKSNRDALGAKVKLTTAGHTQHHHVTTAVGYLSSSTKTLHIGLGPATTIDTLEITWPSGQTQSLTNIQANQLLIITEP